MILKKLIQKLERWNFIDIQRTDHSCNIKTKYDDLLRDSLRQTHLEWKAQQTGAKMDIKATLSRRKYLYLYRIARERKIRGKLTVAMFK